MPPVAHKPLGLPGLVLLNLAALICPACSLIGLGLGAMNPKYREVDIHEIEGISPGSQVQVSIYPKRHLSSPNKSKSDGITIKEVTGIYRGTAPTVDINARVKIVTTMLDEIRTQQSREDSIQKAGEVIQKLEHMKLREIANRVREAVSILRQKPNIKSATASGAETEGDIRPDETASSGEKYTVNRDQIVFTADLQEEEIRASMEAALTSIPSMNRALLVDIENDTELIPFRRVQQLQVKEGNHWRDGLLCGLILDVILILVIEDVTDGTFLPARVQ